VSLPTRISLMIRLSSAWECSWPAWPNTCPTAAARAGIDRRRRNRRIGAGLLAAATVASIVAVAAWMAGGSPYEVVRTDAAAPSAAPDGWRWASSRGVEALVPDTWSDGWTYGLLANCFASYSEPIRGRADPYVGRTADSSLTNPLQICPRVDVRTPVLWFDDYRAPSGVREHNYGWVEETRLVVGVKVTAFTNDDGQRRTVMGSLRAAGDTDVYGCPVHHPVAEHPDTRPSGSGLATVGDVDAISVCSYTSEQVPGGDLPPLLASTRLTGTKAQKVVDAILAAPEGSGPNGDWEDPLATQAPASVEVCRKFRSMDAPGVPYYPDYGYERLLLVVHGSQRDQEVVVRFSGCNHHGTDDGQVERQLTDDVAGPLIDIDSPTHDYYGLSGPIVDLLPP
jgi:hypothetical protein